MKSEYHHYVVFHETMMLPGSVYSIDQDHVLVVSWMEVHKQSSLPAATRWMI